MFSSIGYEILDYGFAKTPNESIKFDYYFNHDQENLYVIAGQESKDSRINLPKKNVPKNINNFIYKLKLKYAKLMLINISYNLFKTFKILKNFYSFFYLWINRFYLTKSF